MSRLRLSEAEWSESFPATCIRCGAPATEVVSRTFRWFPPLCFLGLFLGLLPFAVLVLVLRKKATVTSLPVCRWHRWHWDVAFGVHATYAVVFFGTLILAIMMMADRANPTRVSSGEIAVWVALWLIVVAGLPLGIQVASRTVWAARIEDNSLTLAGVSPKFVLAYEQATEAPHPALPEGLVESRAGIMSLITLIVPVLASVAFLWWIGVPQRLLGPPRDGDPVALAIWELKWGSWRSKNEAAARLATMTPDERREEVAQLLESLCCNADHVNAAWGDALGVWGTEKNVPALIKKLGTTKTYSTDNSHAAAIRALGKLKDRRAIEPLVRCLEDVFDRTEAAKALDEIGAPR